MGVPAISTGDMLRASVEAGTELGLRVAGVMARGDLVDDDLMAEVIHQRLAEVDASEGFLLDGYPRTPSQAETLMGILAEGRTELDAVVLIDAPDDVLIARALGRGRKDDQEHVVRDRLRVYEEKTAPLVAYYDGLGVLRRIDGDATIDAVQAAIEKSLGA
jgi:adenylate kinase